MTIVYSILCIIFDSIRQIFDKCRLNSVVISENKYNYFLL